MQMETIKWIETPKCTKCVPRKSYYRNNACRGCVKLVEMCEKKMPAGERNARKKRAVKTGTVAEMRRRGFSYSQIALRLGLPRSTVQSAAKRLAASGG